MAAWPEWREWELELSPHVFKRMLDRGFSETDLRVMMDQASACRRTADPARWAVDTRHEGVSWQIIVEPDPVDELVVVITAYLIRST